MKNKISLILTAASLFVFQANAQVANNGPALAAGVAPANWGDYCVAGGVDKPVSPKMSHPDVKKAYDILSKVSSFSFYFYSGPVKAYKLKKPTAKADAYDKSVGEANANIYLSVLCGEFKDRPTMIREKIKWIHNLYRLPTAEQQPAIVAGTPLWKQVTTFGYRKYLRVSSDLWEARHAVMPQVKLGNYTVDAPVEGQLMCETRYLLSEYVAKGRDFDGLDKYNAGYANFSGSCTQEEKDYYYDFRGDSNFKPNSPESNGMIWYSSSITNQCESVVKAKAGSIVKDADCVNYFKAPFASRWNAARAGLATWLFRDKKHDPTFSSEGSDVTIVPHFQGNLKPFGFKFSGETVEKAEFLPNWSLNAWNKADIGFNSLMKLGTAAADKGFAYERLRDAVNRHTDWYSSGYDDKMGTVKDQAYSPFVASSYEMSKSDMFTSPGITVNSPSDGKKHWMFVFKVHKDNWYNTNSLLAGKPIDFDRHWFDETSFGTNGLAKGERAWDRMGTALEGEMDSILYLNEMSHP